MKAFKKWWNKGISNKQFEKKYEYVKTEEEFLDALAESVWRAASENVLHQMNTNKFMDNGELRTYIEKELEN